MSAGADQAGEAHVETHTRDLMGDINHLDHGDWRGCGTAGDMGLGSQADTL